MKRILFISYYFPPLGGGGVQRPLQWARHLPEHGWLPTVLSVEGGYWSSRDETGLARIPSEVQVVRTPYLSAVTLRDRIRRRLESKAPAGGERPEESADPGGARAWLIEKIKPLWQTPDEFFGWYPYALREARRLLAQEPYDALLSTAPPYTCHWIARALRLGGGPPWVADFRDAWTAMPGYPHTAPLQLAIERRMERRVLAAADRLIATTEPTAADFVRRCRRLAGHAAVIPNGYDPDLFSGEPLYRRGERLRFVFTGTQLLGQDLGRFLGSLVAWVGDDGEKRAAVRLCYAGPEGAAVERAARAAGAHGLAEIRGCLSNPETARLQRKADVLLLPLYREEVARSVVPGKLFEYLGARRPVLALSARGPAARIIERARAGWVVPPGPEAALSSRLDAIWASWRTGPLELAADFDWIAENFSRPRQVGRLATLLNELVAPA